MIVREISWWLLILFAVFISFPGAFFFSSVMHPSICILSFRFCGGIIVSSSLSYNFTLYLFSFLIEIYTVCQLVFPLQFWSCIWLFIFLIVLLQLGYSCCAFFFSVYCFFMFSFKFVIFKVVG